MAYIYKVTNTINGKSYVGATKRTAKRRMTEHKTDSRKDFPTMPLHKAIKKYGEDLFTYEIIEKCDDSIMQEREKFWIQELRTIENGYNLSLGGFGFSSIRYDDVKKSLLETRSIKETALLLCCDVGCVRKFAHKENIYDLMLDRDIQYASFSKQVVGYFKDNNTLIFKSCHTAAIYCSNMLQAKGKTQSISSHISDVCKGKRKSAYGIVWKYL